MNLPSRTLKIAGFTMIEMMVAVGLASMVVAGVFSIFSKQVSFSQAETQRSSAANEARLSFDLISGLLRQAESQSIVISYPSKSANPNSSQNPWQKDDGITVDFTLPTGYPIWPNVTPPYDNNAVRLTWKRETKEENGVIYYASAYTVAELPSAKLAPLAGGHDDRTPKIVNFDVWPLKIDGKTPQLAIADQALGGYLLTIATRPGFQDPTYSNPSSNGKDGMANYRTFIATGTVAPRN